jgi:hypothetical protein
MAKIIRAVTALVASAVVLVAVTAPRGMLRLPGYALYGVCDDRSRRCLYRRLDVTAEVEVVSPR